MAREQRHPLADLFRSVPMGTGLPGMRRQERSAVLPGQMLLRFQREGRRGMLLRRFLRLVLGLRALNGRRMMPRKVAFESYAKGL